MSIENDVLLNDEDYNDPHSDLAFKELEYDPEGNPNSARAIHLAADGGLEVKYPAPQQLFIDIDNDHSFKLYQRQVDILRKYVGVFNEEIAPSRNGLPGRHITLTFRPFCKFTETQRIALQACMGSDRVRELLSYVQNENGDPHPTLFLEKSQSQAALQKQVEQKLLASASEERPTIYDPAEGEYL